MTSSVLAKYDVPAPRYTSYPTVPGWSSDFGSLNYTESLRRAGAPVSLYVHIPFCEERCLFCGCNVVIAKKTDRAAAYIETLRTELNLIREVLGRRRTLSSMHWGGGTPTFLPIPMIEALFAAIEDTFELDSELSVEIDPRVTTVSQLEVLRRLGFNRVSMGVQDFNPVVQAAIGRVQPTEQTALLLRAARDLGFSSVNFDLIYGLPHQTEKSWDATLDQVVELGPDRVAVFGMAYVPALKPHQKRLPIMPSGAAKLKLFDDTIDRLSQAGWSFIGMDHFARPEDDLAKAAAAKRLHRNFQGYSTDIAEVIGIGASAISDVGGAYAQNAPALVKYTNAIQAGRFATIRGFRRSADDDRRRAVIGDLMCNFECDVGRGFERELAALNSLEADGLVVIEDTLVRVTDLGRRFIRNIASVFDAYLTSDAVHARGI